MMSLIGSEVDPMKDNALGLQPQLQEHGGEGTTETEGPLCLTITEDNMDHPNHGVSNDVNQLLSPVSPPRPAERLFLSNLTTQNISASALMEQIHQSGSSSRSSQRSSRRKGGNLSVQTDASTVDWVSAAGTDDDTLYNDNETPTLHPISTHSTDTLQTPFSDTSDEESAYERFFKKDILSRKIRDLSEVDEDTYLDSDMATPSSTMSTPTKFFPTEVPQHVDAAEKVYDTAKGVWAWGKGVIIFKPFLGLTEAVAVKVADMIGSDLPSVDGIVLDKLHNIDDSLLNPAITAILGALLGAAGKTEDVLKPLIISILKPLGLIKDSPENPELTTVPGVTTVVQ
jgi:hypothetical protein